MNRRIVIKSPASIHPCSLDTRWSRLSHWLGLSGVSRRSWFGRLPAILGASLILAFFIWTAGIDPEDLTFAPHVTLLGLGLASRAKPKCLRLPVRRLNWGSIAIRLPAVRNPKKASA